MKNIGEFNSIIGVMHFYVTVSGGSSDRGRDDKLAGPAGVRITICSAEEAMVVSMLFRLQQ